MFYVKFWKGVGISYKTVVFLLSVFKEWMFRSEYVESMYKKRMRTKVPILFCTYIYCMD